MAREIKVTAVFEDKISRESKRATANLTKNLNAAGKSTGGLTNKSAMLAGALGGVAGVVGTKLLAALAKMPGALTSSAASVEDLTLQFKTLLGSVEAAQARITSLIEFSARTPFEIQEVAAASKLLQTLTDGALATEKGLTLVGDAAAATGADFQNLTLHVGRAYAGLQANRPVGESMMRLMELGIVSAEARNEIERLQKQARGKEAWQVLQGELSKSSGSMKDLSQSFNGLVSTLRGEFFLAFAKIGGRITEFLKGPISSFIDMFKQARKDGTFELFAIGLRGIAEGLFELTKGFARYRTGGFGVQKTLKMLGLAFASFGTLVKGVGAVVGNFFSMLGKNSKDLIDTFSDMFSTNTLYDIFVMPFIEIFNVLQAVFKEGMKKAHIEVITTLSDMLTDINVFGIAIPKFLKEAIGFDERVATSMGLAAGGVNRKLREATEERKKAVQAFLDLPLAQAIKESYNKVIENTKEFGASTKEAYDGFIEGMKEVWGVYTGTIKKMEAGEGAAKGKGKGIQPLPIDEEGMLRTIEEIVRFWQLSIAESENQLKSLSDQVRAQETILDIALRSMKDQFQAARLEATASADAEIVEIKELLAEKLISEKEAETAITLIRQIEANKRKEIDEEEKMSRIEKWQEATTVISSAINKVTGSLSQMFQYERENIQRNMEENKESIERNVRSKRMQAKLIENLEKKAAAESRSIRKKELMASLASALANTAEGFTKALAMSGPLGFITGASVLAAGGIQAAVISSQISKLAKGGIVPGKGNKDTEPALLTPGEMVINREQQARLFDIAEGRARSSNRSEPISINFSENITVNGNLDMEAARDINNAREKQLNKLKEDLEELRFRGQLVGV